MEKIHRQDKNKEIVNIFDKAECLNISSINLSNASKEYRKKIIEVLPFILLFPSLWVFLALYNILSTEGPANIELIIVSCIPFLFLSFAIYIGHLGLTSGLRKKISINKRSPYDLKAIEELIWGKKQYILYLRDFSTGADYHSSQMVKAPGIIGGYGETYSFGSIRLESVSFFLSKYFPIVMLNNSRDETGRYSGYILHCPDHLWFDYFKNLADFATIIVLDYQGEFQKSDAIKSEIEYIEKLKKNYILVGSKGELARLEKMKKFEHNTIRIIVETKWNSFHKGLISRKGKEQVMTFPKNMKDWLRAIKSDHALD